jgi:biotin carboxyl carrier protein
LRYEIEAAGRIRRVDVARTGGAFAVRLDGRLHRVDVVRIDAHALSLIVDSRGDAPPRNRTYEATIVAEGAGRVIVGIGPVPVAVAFGGAGAVRESRRRTGASGPSRIAAPMPGKIVRVLVSPGDVVRARQPLVVVEAMKMENELRADRDGTVVEVHAREGSSVEAGTLLIIVQ